jgi:hypothetical protein
MELNHNPLRHTTRQPEHRSRQAIRFRDIRQVGGHFLGNDKNTSGRKRQKLSRAEDLYVSRPYG